MTDFALPPHVDTLRANTREFIDEVVMPAEPARGGTQMLGHGVHDRIGVAHPIGCRVRGYLQACPIGPPKKSKRITGRSRLASA
jgi:hypothetical protein